MPACRSTPVLSQWQGLEASLLLLLGILQGQSRADFFQEAFSNPPVPTDRSEEPRVLGSCPNKPVDVPPQRAHLRWLPHSVQVSVAQVAHLTNARIATG